MTDEDDLIVTVNQRNIWVNDLLAVKAVTTNAAAARRLGMIASELNDLDADE